MVIKPVKFVEISDRQRFWEMGAVLLTGVAKFILVDGLHFKFLFIFLASLFWISFLMLHFVRNRQIFRYWGLTVDNFREVFQFLTPIALVTIGIFFLLGYYRDSMILNWHLIPILILYPLWGTLQQFIIVGLIAGNLKDLQKYHWSETSIVLLTSIVFSLVHYPNTLLMLGTFGLCLLYAKVYLWRKNLLVLGLFHGWLGGLFYFIVLGRDPWIEVFGPAF